VAETLFQGGNRRDSEASSTERRRSSRFPIERELRYKTLSQRAEAVNGTGKTLNISSSGVLFTASHDLAVGTRLEVSISWPAQLNERCLLNLVARGRVARKEEGQLALQIQQYEFRTQSLAPISPLSGPSEAANR
jgi:hypothetical protein